MNFELTPEEQEIEDNIEQLRPVSEEKRKRVEAILDRARQSQAISLRVPKHDLELIKRRAESEGLPYQTLINAVLHKYVTDQLYDKRELRKALSGLEGLKAT